VPRGPVVDRPLDARADSGERLELLDRRVAAVRDDCPGVEQRPEGVRAVRLLRPEAVCKVSVGRRVRELHGGGDAELGEPRQVLGCEALRVLDSRA
jgi:hypothetical protein